MTSSLSHAPSLFYVRMKTLFLPIHQWNCLSENYDQEGSRGYHFPSTHENKDDAQSLFHVLYHLTATTVIRRPPVTVRKGKHMAVILNDRIP